MCYSRCPYENSFSGECNNPRKNSRNIDAHCNNDFICSVCNEQHSEDELSDFEGTCVDCAVNYFKCSECEEVYSKEDASEKNSSICCDCAAEAEENNKKLQGEIDKNYLEEDSF